MLWWLDFCVGIWVDGCGAEWISFVVFFLLFSVFGRRLGPFFFLVIPGFFPVSFFCLSFYFLFFLFFFFLGVGGP